MNPVDGILLLGNTWHVLKKLMLFPVGVTFGAWWTVMFGGKKCSSI
jgi:hypothetical protein